MNPSHPLYDIIKMSFFQAPREIANHTKKRLWILDSTNLQKYYLDNRTQTDCYVSVYAYTRANLISKQYEPYVLIDKVALDFDNELGYECMTAFHQLCMDHNWIHTINFTGRICHRFGVNFPNGFHCCVYTTRNITHRMGTVYHIHEYLLKEIVHRFPSLSGITISPEFPYYLKSTNPEIPIIADKPKPKNILDITQFKKLEEEDKGKRLLDATFRGNIAAIIRFRSSLNSKYNRYVLPLQLSDFSLNPADLIKISTSFDLVNQRTYEQTIMGEELLCTDPYDHPRPTIAINPSIAGSILSEEEMEYLDSFEFFPLNRCLFGPCLVQLFTENNPGNRHRYIIIMFLKEFGFSLTKAYEILKVAWQDEHGNPTRALIHGVQDEHQLVDLYHTNPLGLICCPFLKSEKCCPGTCGRRHPFRCN